MRSFSGDFKEKYLLVPFQIFTMGNYIKHAIMVFLSNPNNISFSWYTDGIPVFKSSKLALWPLYLTINELPFEERKKRENR